MKRIIAFVLLGLLIYAGGFVIVYSLREINVITSVPQPITGNLRDGGTAEGKIRKTIAKLGTKTYQETLLGLPIGEKITQYYYIIPVSDSETPNYMLLAVSDPADIEAVGNLPSGEFKFTGISVSMDREWKNKLIEYLKENPKLTGMETNPYTDEIAANNRITPYIIKVCEIGNPDYTPIWVGLAMCVVGIGLAALLALKIFREKSGY